MKKTPSLGKSLISTYSIVFFGGGGGLGAEMGWGRSGRLFEFDWEERWIGGGRLFETGRLSTFFVCRMGAYSRWALFKVGQLFQ